MKKIILRATPKINSGSHAKESRQAFELLKQSLKRKESFSSLLPLLLAACGGGSTSPAPTQPPPPPTPDFTESPTNTFTARDNNNRTLSQSAATANLIVIGKDGDDTITTGSGADVINGGVGNDTITSGSGNDVIKGGAGDDTINSGDGADMILGGAGSDIVNAGAGDDIIVLIGRTSASQYSDAAIASPAGSGADLSALLSLADINGHSVSDIYTGETFDGGEGNNTLVIYGETNILGLTFVNLTALWVNSQVTLYTDQLSSFTSVIGDGTSVLHVISKAENGAFDQVDLRGIDISGIGSVTINGRVEFLISDASQLAGISELVTTQFLIITIMDGATINASDLAGMPAGIDHLEIAAGATLVLDTVEGVAALGDIRLTGAGTIVVSDVVAAGVDSLVLIQIDEDGTFVDSAGLPLDITTLGGVLVPDIDPGDGVLPILSVADISAYENDGSVTFTINLDAAYYNSISLGYYFSGLGYSNITFAPGEISQAITINISDDSLYETTHVYELVFSDSSYVTFANQTASFTLYDDEAVEPDGSPDILNNINTDAIISVGGTVSAQITHDGDADWVGVTLLAGHVYLAETLGVSGGFGTMVTPMAPAVYGATGILQGLEPSHTLPVGQSYFSPVSDGTYYVSADGTPGTYTLRVTEVDASEPDGSADIGSDIAGSTMLVLDTPLDQNISYNGDTDMYQVTLVAGVAYLLSVDGLASLSGTLSDPSVGFLLNSTGQDYLDVTVISEANTDAQVTFMVTESGTYYVPISSGGGEGTYTVSLTTPVLTEPGGIAEIGNTQDTALTVVDGDVIDGSIGFVNDQDWFAIDMVAGEVYTFYVDHTWTSGFDWTLGTLSPFVAGVYFSDGTQLETAGAGYGNGAEPLDQVGHFTNFVAPATGTYYFNIDNEGQPAENEYQLTVSLIDTTEPDASADVPDDITSTVTVPVNGLVDGTLHSDVDRDVYQITLAAGEVYEVDMATLLNADGVYDWTSVFIYNDQNQEIVGWYDGIETLDGFTLYFEPEVAGNYYIVINSNDHPNAIDYNVSLTQIDTTEPDGSADYGNSVDTATIFDIATILSGTISYQYDEDFLAVELVAGQSYTFTMSGDATYGNALAVGDINQIHDRDGFSYFGIEGENISVDGTDTFTFTAHYTGTFYLELNDGNSAESGDYTLSVANAGLVEPDGSPDIAAGPNTTTVIAVDDTTIGGVGLEYDRDWYAVEFVAGNVYQITLTGDASGTGTLIDPRIHLIYDASGVGIAGAFNDDGYGESRESFMLFTAPYTGTYYIAAGGWDAEIGTYELSVSDVSSTHTGDLPYGPTNAETFPNIDFVDISGDFRIDGLLFGTRYTIDPDGTTTTITYSIPEVNSFYSTRFYGDVSMDSEPWVGFESLTSGQLASFQDFIVYLETFINIDLVQVSDSYGSAGTIRIAWTDLPPEGAAAWAYLPEGTPYSGDIWLSVDNVSASNKQPSNYLYHLYLHEMGHALGLKHTFETDGYYPAMPLAYDSHQWSVMAYDFHASYADAYAADLYPQTYMYFDILALQYLYGAIETNMGDNTYVFDGNERYYMTIWDNGGVDTIEFINQSDGVHVDLGGGQWQDVGTTINYSTDHGPETEDYTVFIPEEVLIENVYGTAHSDTIAANAVDNSLLGGGGDDLISGLGGNDTIDGGLGQDSLTGGTEADIFVTRAGDGGALITDADMVMDFTDGEDLVGLNGLSYADLTIEAGTGDHAGDTIITVTSSGEYLMVLDGIDVSLVTVDDFTPIADEWWLA